MDYLRQAVSPLILTPECFDTFFVDFNFVDVPCLKHGLSKGLGLAIIAGSILVKVPQIMKIFRNKSAAGITLISVIMELFAITSNLAYSYSSEFPFSAWGEACFLAIQTGIVACLVVFYGYSSWLYAFSFAVGYASVVYTLVSDITPIHVLWSMQAANVPIIVISKMLQAMTNYRNQSTGQLSAVTVFMLFLGSVARIFTSIQETGDEMVIITYAAASFSNAVIAFQIVYYWNSAMKKKPTIVVKGGKGKASPKKATSKSKKR